MQGYPGGIAACLQCQREAIERAAVWLGVDLSDWDAMVKAARNRVKGAQAAFRDEMTGKTIAFAGRGLHSSNIRDALALKHGMVVKRPRSIGLDLLVVGPADLDSAAVSKARETGVPIMVEQGFWERLGEM